MIPPVRLERRWSRVCTSVTLLGLMLAGPARSADPVRIPARLEWGASVCGDAQGFASRVQQRTERVRFVERGEDLAVFLSIEPKGSGLEARVVMKTAAGKPLVTRSIASPDCDDALDALALVVAISLEGRAQEVERARARARPAVPPRRRPQPAPVAPAPPVRAEPEPEPEPAPAPSPEPAPSPRPTPAPETPARVEAAPVPPSPPPEPEPEPPPASVVVEPSPVAAGVERELDVAPRDPTDARTGVWIAAGASAEMALGVAPAPMIGAGLWLGAIWERGSLLSPSLALAVSHVRLDGFEQPDGKADFQLNVGSLALCPVRFGNGTFEVRPCASGTLGEYNSDGHATFFSEDALRPWRALGGSLQALARLGPLELRASLAAETPLVRDKYRFGPYCPFGDDSPEARAACEAGIFHDVGVVTTRLTIGAGVSF